MRFLLGVTGYAGDLRRRQLGVRADPDDLTPSKIKITKLSPNECS
jgi:hypothetical protein